MKIKKHRAEVLLNAPLHYAPENELGVVYLFAHIARKLQVHVEEIHAAFPDCIAYQKVGGREKRIRIEFEFRSRNFKTHKHAFKKCDWIVCWEHDWHDAPRSLRIIELKKFFGVGFKVWIQPAIASQQSYLDVKRQVLDWGLSKRTSAGDLLLMYRCSPTKTIQDVFVLNSPLYKRPAGWRIGDCYAGKIKRICRLASPIFLDDMRKHPVLKTASFVRRNFQGNLQVSEYWFYLHEMIVSRNPSLKKKLSRFAPEKISA
ncbi:MAG TPA: hypothetical protein VIK35_12850 [Verrucomicrobiae bacterium]